MCKNSVIKVGLGHDWKVLKWRHSLVPKVIAIACFYFNY